MSEPTIVVVSDLHCGCGEGVVQSLEPGHYPWSWCSQTARDQFVDWGNALLSRSDVNLVILNGDLVDSWIWPYDVVPPAIDEFYGSSFFAPVLQTLYQLSRQKQLLYLAGNHDMQVTHSTYLGHALPNLDIRTEFENDVLHVEHGNAYCCFTCYDPRQTFGTPIGYYISRLCAAVDRDTGSHALRSRDYTAAILELAGHGNVADAILAAIRSKDSVPDGAVFQTEAGPTTLKTVAQHYDDTLLWFAQQRGLSGLLAGIDGETKSLEPAADLFLAAHKTCKVVVFGHTHVPTLQTRRDGTYANSGCWGAAPAQQTWLEITGTNVLLRYWDAK